MKMGNILTIQVGLLVFIVGAITLNAAFGQTTTNGTAPIVIAPVVESSSTLLTEIATGIASIAAIVLSIIGRMDHFKNKERIVKMTEGVRDGAEMTVKQEEKFKQFGQAIYEMLPEQSQKLADKEAIKIDNLKSDVVKGTNKLENITRIIEEIRRT